jgi:putative oxidoreductase
MGIALLFVRLVLGLGMAAHGAQKLFGWFGGYGIQGTGGFFASIGFRPGPLFALAAGLGEFGGGVLTALGLGGPVGPALMILVMIVAILTVHIHNGFFVTNNGFETPLLYILGALAIAFTGPSPYTLDAVVGLDSLWTPQITGIAIAAAIVLALANVAARRPTPPAAGSAPAKN